MIDICSGWLCEGLAKADIPGYWTIGEGKETDYKIFVVGGSTTADYLYQYSSWPQELHKILKIANKAVTIYNGAVEGYYSMQELSKVARDIRIIKPDMVISFSGLNDAVRFPLARGYINGATGTNPVHKFEHWIENERLMAGIVGEKNIKFFCFAQPHLHLNKKFGRYAGIITALARHFGNEYIDLEWKRKVKEVKEYPWFVDLSDIMENHEDLFFDFWHVTSEGNRVIADHIYEHIKDCIN